MMSAYLNGSTVNMTIDGTARRYTGAYVTEDFLRILGVSPVAGRDFTPEDNEPGAPKVAIIGHALWQRDFGGDDDAVGRVVRINGSPATIVGIMEQGFAFPTNEELWIPLYSEFPPVPREDPTGFSPGVVGLLKPDVAVDQAEAEFNALAQRFAAEYPATNERFNAGQVQPLIQTYLPAPLRGTLLTMLGFCVGVLLIACANVANMQFARATLRARELAIRSSLGANRGRLIRQMLTESLLLSAVGAVLGVVLAYGAIDWLTATVRAFDTPPPSWITFDIRPVVLVVTVGVTVLAAVASGLLPAIGSSRLRAVDVLRDSSRGSTGRRLGLISRGLVVFQVVVTCVLLIGALLQMRSIVAQQTVDYGYDTEQVMSARMGLMDGDYPSTAARGQFYDRLAERLEANPAFAASALTNRFRMTFSNVGPIEIDGEEYAEGTARPLTNIDQVTPGFFAVTGQRLLEGRLFTDQDGDTRQPIAIVNADFARQHFGTESAVGRRVRTLAGGNNEPGPWRLVVGVVSSVRMQGPFNNPGVEDTGFYVPFDASPFGPLQTEPVAPQFATIAVTPRAGPAESLAETVHREVAALDPNLPLYYVGTAKSQTDAFVSQNQVIATLFGSFGIVAVLLAGAGIYGVMSFAVNQRRQELGVRMALGANRSRILRMVLRQSAVQVIVGTALGVLLALGLATVGGVGIQGVLFGVDPRDPGIYASVVALVVLVAFAATFGPARRATRVDPMVALRTE
jgi:putative ABC transport system permease protein